MPLTIAQEVKVRSQLPQEYDMHHLRRLLDLMLQWREWLPRYAVGGAWFFAIASMIPLLWLVIEGHGEGGSSHVFGTTAGGVLHTVWGLTYSGVFGTIVLWLELLALVAAIVITALPGQVSAFAPEVSLRIRRIGHGYLTGWAGLWMLGTMFLASIDPGFWTLQSIFLTIMFGCTVYRAVKESFPRQPKAAQMRSPLNDADDSADLPIMHRSFFDHVQAGAAPSVLEQVQQDEAAVARVASTSVAFVKRLPHLARRGIHRARMQTARLMSTIEARIRPDQRST